MRGGSRYEPSVSSSPFARPNWQGGWNLNTRGGSVVKGAGIAAIAEDELWQLDPSVPHDTRGLRVQWGGAGSRYVGWNLPIANVPLVGAARDVTNYDVLSLRVAQDYLDAWNTAGEDPDFRARLYTGNGWSDFVQVGEHGRIPSPDVFFAAPIPYPAGDFTKSAMTTIRLPLDAFAGADLTDVQWVCCYFDVPGHTAGSFVLDSLEFSR
ncbi:MAG: hypothetical protein JNM25_12335 [Planctomycetes bacterium]|nr:hypothetical protein [Planctomycetota bacterium]